MLLISNSFATSCRSPFAPISIFVVLLPGIAWDGSPFAETMTTHQSNLVKPHLKRSFWKSRHAKVTAQFNHWPFFIGLTTHQIPPKPDGCRKIMNIHFFYTKAKGSGGVYVRFTFDSGWPTPKRKKLNCCHERRQQWKSLTKIFTPSTLSHKSKNVECFSLLPVKFDTLPTSLPPRRSAFMYILLWTLGSACWRSCCGGRHVCWYRYFSFSFALFLVLHVYFFICFFMNCEKIIFSSCLSSNCIASSGFYLCTSWSIQYVKFRQ